jgi:hypothetical protein
MEIPVRAREVISDEIAQSRAYDTIEAAFCIQERAEAVITVAIEE